MVVKDTDGKYSKQYKQLKTMSGKLLYKKTRTRQSSANNIQTFLRVNMVSDFSAHSL